MKNTKRKGFTIVELVIVIAVIAILAAVLIPTFASLINKANRSADIQAVHQMNTLLATYTDGSVENVADAIKALAKENIDLEDYKALQTGHYFYFTLKGDTPMVIYANEKDEIVYPEVNKEDLGQWMSLSGEIPLDSSWEPESGTSVTVSTGAQLADLMIKYADGNATAKSVTSIALTQDINLKGSTASFGEVSGTITFDGGNHTISGIRADSNSELGSWANEPKRYGFALFNQIDKDGVVTVKNLKITDVVVRYTGNENIAFGHSAVLFGKVEGTVNAEDVEINDCYVYGGGKAGSVIGYMTGNATMKNVKVTNTQVLGTAYAAKAAGYIMGTATISFESCNFDGVTTGVNEYDWTSMWGLDKSWTDGSVTVDGIYECSNTDSITIGTAHYKVNSSNKYYKVTGLSSEDYKVVGNHYILYKDGTRLLTNGAYTDDYYWTGDTNTYGTLNGQMSNVNLSSSANRTSAFTPVEIQSSEYPENQNN